MWAHRGHSNNKAHPFIQLAVVSFMCLSFLSLPLESLSYGTSLKSLHVIDGNRFSGSVNFALVLDFISAQQAGCSGVDGGSHVASLESVTSCASDRLLVFAIDSWPP